MKLYIKQIKPVLGNREKNLDIMIQSIDDAIAQKKEIIVFPELSLTGTLLEDIASDVAIREVPKTLLEKSKDIDIVFGAVEIGEDEFLYNTGYYLSNGEIIGKHRKVYLADYGKSTESRVYAHGNKIESFKTKFGKVGLLMKEDFYHQSAQTILAQDGIKFLIVLSNDTVQFGMGEVGEELQMIAKTNSLLNGVFTIVANRMGVEDGQSFYGQSFVVDSNGKMVVKAKAFEEECLTWDLDESEIRRTRIRRPLLKNENIRLSIEELIRIEKNQKY